MSNLPRRLLAAASLLSLVAPVVRAQDANVGWTITTKITSDSGNGAPPFMMLMKQQFQGGKFRMEMDSSTLPTAQAVKGTYSIFDLHDSVMTNVLPSMHIATKMPYSFLSSAMHMSMPAPHFAMDSVVDLGPGGTILGHDTRHYRRMVEGTLEYTLGKRTCTRPISQVGEYWIAPDLHVEEESAAAMKAVGGMGGFDPSTGAAGTRGKLPPGTSLRAIVKSTEKGPDGAARVVTSSVEYLTLAHEKIDDVAFQAPLDYTVQDMGQMMAMMPPGMLDSTMAAAAERTLHLSCADAGKP
ncbi:MAG TPA: hypothetical protein VHB25_04155 [Gemmatimonadaceae bacterium]|nr:hypothetical protein [Gemmatimonadaceae bacterium]